MAKLEWPYHGQTLFLAKNVRKVQIWHVCLKLLHYERTLPPKYNWYKAPQWSMSSKIVEASFSPMRLICLQFCNIFIHSTGWIVLSVWSRVFLDHSISGWLAGTCLYIEVLGNHTNIIYHYQLNFLLVRAPKFMKPLQSLKSLSRVQLFCDPMHCTVHGILQARMLEWVAFPFSKGSSQPRYRNQVFHLADGFFTSWATREAPVGVD